MGGQGRGRLDERRVSVGVGFEDRGGDRLDERMASVCVG